MSTIKYFACPDNTDPLTDLIDCTVTQLRDTPDKHHTEECRVVGAHGTVIKYVRACECGKKHDFVYDTTNNVGDNGPDNKKQPTSSSPSP